MQTILSVAHINDLLTLAWLFIALTMAYRRNGKPLLSAGLFILCLAGGFFSILLQEKLLQNFGLYMLIFILWGCIYGAAALKGPMLWKASMVFVYVCEVFHLGKCASLVLSWMPDLVRISQALGVVICQLFVIWAALFLACHAVTTERKVPKVCWMSLMGVSLLGICLAYYQGRHDPGPSFRVNAALYSLGVVIVVAVMQLLCSRIIDSHEQDLVRLAMEEGGRGEAAMARQASHVEEALRSYRQEMNHHIAALSALLENGQTDDARALLEEISAAPAPAEQAVRSGNAVVDAILNQKAAACREHGIEFTADVLLTESMPLSDTEFTSLLGNLLSNAMEAAVQCQQPFIRVNIYPDRDYLCVDVVNSADSDRLCANPELNTAKQDPQLHGIGLRVVRAIADQHNGTALFDTGKAGQFSAKVLIRLS